MSLHVHRAERSDRLAAGLADLLARPLDDVFAEEVVAVPARGVERWLTQRLSHRLGRRTDGPGDGREDGVCAGVRFPSPTTLLAEVVGVEEHDVWAPDSLVWPLLETIDACAGEAWCHTLGTHLGAGAADDDQGSESAHRRGRRYAVARRLAGLFDSYASHRPAMLAAWAAGDDSDGFGDHLPPDLAWQAELWRRVRERIGGPGPVERLAVALTRMRADPTSVDLPQRLSLFGATRLTTSQVQVLSALAEDREVHLWLPHPSPELWRRVAELRPTGPIRRRTDPTVTAPAHPLLSSLGRDSRELQLVLAQVPATDHHHPLEDTPATLLSLLQRDLREDRRPDRAARSVIADTDRSVQVHACHGPSRQVDVLREVLVGLLAADDTLEPRDVLVMCPDIEVYAPLISAAFGLADVVEGGHPAHELRVRLADRALRQTNPLLATVSRLLELADGRVTASQVLDLAAWPPVRRRFGFDDDDLEKLARWVGAAGVRWGLDAEHREAYGLSDYPQNTWRAGLDRILLGVAMADEDRNWLGLALPLDDVGSNDVDLAGRLAELLDRLESALDDLVGEQCVQDWLDTLADAVQSLTSVAGTELWQSAELYRELGAVAEAAAERAASTSLSLADLRALFAGRLGGRPTRANFRTGTLTVCTMVPMRSVPHRVIGLLGLDDGAFPRGARIDGDDVLARDPAVGERDPRGEDRQLMLDALLAATEHVVITYTGADERTGAPRPPAVPLGELLDALDDTAVTADGAPIREQVLVRHPLQPFDARNVTPGELGVPGPFSFDPTALAGATAASGPRATAGPFLSAPLPPPEAGDVDLAALVSLLQKPVRGFLRQRLDVAVRFEETEPTDALAVELDNLEKWSIGDRLLRDRLAGADQESCQQAEWRRGVLPPGRLGARTLMDLLAEVEPLVNGTVELRATPATAVDVVVPLADGRELRGTVPGVHGTCLVTIGYSRLAAGPRLRAWILLVALTAAHPDLPWTAVTVGRGRAQSPQKSSFGAIDPAVARTVLDQLVDLYDRALCQPLPLSLKTSAAYAEARDRDEPPAAIRQASRRWRSDQFPGEDADSAHLQVWGSAPLETLLLEEPRADERWAGEPTRFGELALRLWTPLLEHERLTPL
jgi:exodeoxyribonuclease V gamma subunit